ncbi:MAG: glycosyltransferase family 39 protein [Planctomycetales bacterium]|nr:glycosyltransferase family 39 protein [Planctomycetales bacterium]
MGPPASSAVVVAGGVAALALARGVGRWAARPGDLEDPVVEAVVGVLLGLALLAAATGALLATGLIGTPVTWVAFGTWGLLGLAGLLRLRHGSPRPGVPQSPSPARRVALGAGGAAMAIAILGACAPATGWDATTYQFAIPAYWLRAGGMPARLDWLYYYYPPYLGFLNAAGLLLGGTTGAALVGVFCYAATGALLWRWAALAGSPAAGPLAALGFFACFSVGFQADAGIAEPPLLAFGTAAMLLLVRAREAGDSRALTLAALLSGFALGAKPTALGLLIPWAALALRPGPLPRRRVALAAALAAGLAAPAYLRAVLATGNPLWPSFAGLLPAPFAAPPRPPPLLTEPVAALGEALWHFGAGYGGVALALLAAVARPGALARTALPGAAAFVVATVAGISLAYTSSPDNVPRLVSLAFPPLLVAGAASAVELAERRAWLRWLGVLALGGGLLLSQGLLGIRAARKLPVVLGLTGRDEYLADRISTYPLVRHVNRIAEAPGRPLRVLLTDGRSLYLEREFVYAAEHHAWVDWRALDTPEKLRRRLAELGVTHLIASPLGGGSLLARARADPEYLDPRHFRLLLRHTGASREGHLPAELYEFAP